MAIKCCKDCVPPQRHSACHASCEKYLTEKAEYEKQKEAIKASRDNYNLTSYDFDEIAYAGSKRHKRRRR